MSAHLPPRWSGMVERLPDSLAELDGPSGGLIELPNDLVWSGQRTFDLSDGDDRYLYHVIVLTSAFARDHFVSWLNRDLLTTEWPRLGLPGGLRRIWQERFPELGQGARGRAV